MLWRAILCRFLSRTPLDSQRHAYPVSWGVEQKKPEPGEERDRLQISENALEGVIEDPGQSVDQRRHLS